MKDKFWPPNSSEWTEVTPEEQGLDSNKIADMFKFIEKNSYDIHSVIIVRNGYLLTEEYLHNSTLLGTKSYFGGEKIHMQQSVVKSFTSILIGIALQEGFLDNVNQTLYEFFADIWSPSFVDSELKKNITIEQLLTMNAGFMPEYDPKYPSGAKTHISTGCIEWALERVPIGYTPGEEGKWEYSNDGVNLLSAIITKVSGKKSAAEFAQEYLFTPLGISEDETYWWHDDKGVNYGGYAFSCSPKVQAKFGILCLNNGTWNDTQIVDKDYIKEATSTKSSFGGKGDYGYLFFIDDTYKGYMAAGAGGQSIIVIPKYNIVVGITAASQGKESNDLLENYILNFAKDT